MKRIVLIAFIAMAAWQYMEQRGSFATVTSSEPDFSRFSCDGRQYCSQMTSKEEALFFTRHCPNTKMDGDRDGEPCENDSRF